MAFKKNIPVRRPVPLQRQHRLYLDDLRIDFSERCGYCDLHDSVFGGKEQFEVDHFIPYKIAPEKNLEYTNLVYSCRICNRFKSGKYTATGGFIDPVEAQYDDLFSYSADFKFCHDPSNNHSKYVYKELKFYLKLRQKLNLLSEIERINKELCSMDPIGPVLELCYKIIKFRQILIK